MTIDEAQKRYKSDFRRIRHIPGQPVTYLQNPKVASTSIKLTLWGAHDPQGVPRDPHAAFGRAGNNLVQRPFIRNLGTASDEELESLLKSRFFSVVRNPYARLLSAYLDKVGPGRRPWKRLSGMFGVAPESHPTLGELLTIMSNSDPYQIDYHFRPQHINLLHGVAPLDFLGYLERMDEVVAFLAGHGLKLERHDAHATHAASRISDHIGPDEARLLQRVYERDFELFGYGDDPAVSPPAGTAAAMSADRAPLRKYLKQQKFRAARFANRPARGQAAADAGS